MADKSFGVKELNLIGGSGVPTIESPNNLNLNANQVSISADVSIGGVCMSDLVMGPDYSISASTLTTSTLNAISLPSATTVDDVVDPGVIGELFTMSITSIFTGSLSADFHNEIGVLSASLKVVCSSTAV